MLKIQKSPLLGRFLLWLALDEEDFTEMIGDFDEAYIARKRSGSYIGALLWYWRMLIKSLPSIMIANLYWRFIMFRNYLKTAFRNIKRQKGYSFINIFGLSLGLTICIFILLYVRYELSYDSHHNDSDHIYRIVSTVKAPTFTNRYGGVNPHLSGLIKGNLPQIEYVTWTWSHNVDSQVEVRDFISKEESKHVMFADEDFLKIFSVNFKYGNPNSAFMNPNSALITTEIAKKYFGSENALDKTITVDSVNYRVTGIIEESPGNSIFKHKILTYWDVLADPLDPSRRSVGFGGFFQTFVKLHPGSDKGHFENQIEDMIAERNKDYLEQTKAEVVVTLQPLQDIHFYPDLQFDLPASGNILYITVFAGIALFILAISLINFVNLSTASSANRSGEVGIRKAVGAHRKQLIAQFMGESFLTVAISYLIAFLMVNLLLPRFNAITSLRLEYSNLFGQDVLMGLGLLFLIEGIVAGIYPALFLSSYKPVSVLNGQLKTGTKSGTLRRILVIVQFSVSTLLIIVTFVFNLQLHYMKHTPLGFEKEQMLIVDFQRHNYRYDPLSVKDEFLKHPSVIGASFSSTIPGRWYYPWDIWPSGQRETNTRPIHVMAADKDFLTIYKINLIAGENFKESHGTRTWIFNEKAVRTFGWDSPEDALNKTFMDNWKAIGVMKDFHFTGLQKMIEPVGLFHVSLGSYLSLKIRTNNMRETLFFIEQTYHSMFPGKYLEYFFLDDDFNRHYSKEEQMIKIFNNFTLLGIFIACLGLLGLSTFIAQQKTKEIGIRKILGASTHKITVMIAGEFVRCVTISNIIAWPLAFIIKEKILQSFAYRVDSGIKPFLLTGVTTILIALISVGFQTMKVAFSNPVDSLRCE